MKMLVDGGPVLWAIAASSVLALANVLWKAWRFSMLGVWRRARTEDAMRLWVRGDHSGAEAMAASGQGVVSRVLAIGMSRVNAGAAAATAREETARVARSALSELRVGLRGLEVIVTITPLLGLLGTVLGMIVAFQALESAGGRADPSALAGGIWTALLTTAAGMAVAIPAGIALSWCESTIEAVRARMEDAATQIFTARSSMGETTEQTTYLTAAE
ncbi:MAG: MotA/TolQ/ExbB proton channel family protein [Neomegalonema sp.]